MSRSHLGGEADQIPLNASALPEAFYTGALIAFFAHLSSSAAEPLWTEISWALGGVVVSILAYAVYCGFSVRQRWPWRWSRALIYCLGVAAALALLNNGWSRLGVFALYLLYAVIVHFRLRNQPDAKLDRSSDITPGYPKTA